MINYHNHSDFSLKDGLSRVEDIVKKCKEYGHKSVCITDHGQMGSSLLLFEECKKENLKPIFGVEFYMKMRDDAPDLKERAHLVVIAKNHKGWLNLLKINREAYDNFYRVPLITFDILDKYREGLLCTTACFAGPVAQFLMPGKTDLFLARKHYERLVNIFGKDDVYIELQPNSMKEQVHLNNMLYSFAKEYGSKLSLGYDSHYIKQSDAEVQETLLGINFKSNITMPTQAELNAEVEGIEEVQDDEDQPKENKLEVPKSKKTRFVFSTKDFWFLSDEECKNMFMANHFLGLTQSEREEIYNKLISGNNEIENKTEEFDIKPKHEDLLMKYPFDINEPKFVQFCKEANVPVEICDRLELAYQYLRMLTYEGFYNKEIDKKPNVSEYIERIKHELSEIKEAEIIDYFLIVWDILNFCKNNGIPTGPGRGCCSGDTRVFKYDNVIKHDSNIHSNICLLYQGHFENIINIKVGDIVVTESGEYKKVKRTMSYKTINSEKLIEFTLKGDRDLIRYGKFTKDHKIAIAKSNFEWNKFEWKEAKDVKIGDMVYTPGISMGYMFEVINKNQISGIDMVYDLEVEGENHSYLTDFGIVHNSAAGSLVASLIGIHGVDSLQYGLLWERFYNAGRKGSMPDVDIDISQKYRYKVIEYLKQKYGEDKTGHICNYTYFSPKNTLKYVLKFYNFEYESVNKAVKGVNVLDYDEQEAKDRNLTRDMALMNETLKHPNIQELIANSPHKDMIIRDCMSIIGGVANMSVHASGVVITAKPLTELCPVMIREKNKDMQTAMWDMQMLDSCGFLKTDLLGLESLDVINDCLDLIKEKKGVSIDWKSVPLDDKKVMELFQRGETTGVFQFDYGKELQRWARKFKPKDFADICALTALARPGAKAFLETYQINREKDESHIIAPDPDALKILKDTNYVVAYQEQQMALSRVLAGFSLKEADNLRKIIAKKKIDKLEEMRLKFQNGYIKQHSDKMSEEQATAKANDVWNEYFASCSYTFNKSHAVSYSVTTYAMAWLKTYYPVEFMCSVLNHNNNGKRDKLLPYILETIKMGIEFAPPSWEYPCYDFEICQGNPNKIRAGLSSIKGISRVDYDDLEKFGMNDAMLKELNKNKYEALINSGFFDGFGTTNRAEKINNIARHREWVVQVEEYNQRKERYAALIKKYEENMKEYEEKLAKYPQRLKDYEEYMAAHPEGKKKKPVEPEKPNYPRVKEEPMKEFVPMKLEEFSYKERVNLETELLGYSTTDENFKYMPFLLTATIRKTKDMDKYDADEISCIYGRIMDIKIENKEYSNRAKFKIKVDEDTSLNVSCDEKVLKSNPLIVEGNKCVVHVKIKEFHPKGEDYKMKFREAIHSETLDEAYTRWLKQVQKVEV